MSIQWTRTGQLTARLCSHPQAGSQRLKLLSRLLELWSRSDESSAD
jgi:hypothetical protein